MVHETRKIMGDPSIAVNATCIRVPVFYAHSESVTVETEKPLSAAEARALLEKAPGVRVIDEPEKKRYPMPIDCRGHRRHAGRSYPRRRVVRQRPLDVDCGR